MKKVLILCLLAVLGVLNQANSQSQFIPEFFTNRPLILLNDATSVGWNPAVLGIDAKADLAFLAGYNRRFESNRLFGAFYAQNGFGFGITTQRNEQLPTYSFIPFSFYAGGGVKIPNERAWAGASFRYSEFGNSSIRFNGSFIYQPMEDFYVSAGITNFNSLNSDNLQYQFSSSYALLDWLNLFGRMQFTSDSMLFAGEKRSIDIGINASIQKNVINTSFFVNPVLREARFGLECSIGAFTVGAINEGSTVNSPDNPFRGGNFLLRIDPEHFDTHEEEPCETVSCDVKGCKGRACTRALYGAYRCIRKNCPGIPCRDNCFGPECHPKEECTNHCPICKHPIINNWTINILVKPHCTFCSCTHHSHNYYIKNYWIYNFPKEYITTYVHDTIIQWKTKFIYDTVYKYRVDTVIKVVNDCSKCPKNICKHIGTCWHCKGDGCSHCHHSGYCDCSGCTKHIVCSHCKGKGCTHCEICENCGGKGCKGCTGTHTCPPCKPIIIIDTIRIHDTIRDCPPVVIIDDDIIFPPGKDTPELPSLKFIEQLINLLKNNPNLCISIEAHTDSDGSDEDNMILSQKRAQKVADLLIAGGIEPWRIVKIEGKGEREPKCFEDTKECKRINRRVEYILNPC